MKKYFILPAIVFGVLLLFCKCRKPNEKTDIQQLVQIIVDWDQESDFDLGLISDSVQIIPFPNSKDCLIGRIKDLIYKDRLIFIQDDQTHTVFIYDSLLNYRSKISHYGRGAGEYLSISGMAVADSSVFIYDHSGCKILAYDYDGNYIDAKMISGWGGSLFSLDSLLYLVNDWSDSDLGRYHLFGYNTEKEFRFKFLPFSENDIQRGWSEDSYYSVFQNEALIFFSSCDTIYKVKGKEVVPIYHLDFGSRGLPEKLLKGNSYETVDYIMKNPQKISGVKGIDETKDFIFFRTNGGTIAFNKQESSARVYRYLLNPELGGDNISKYRISGNKLFCWRAASDFRFFWDAALKNKEFVDVSKKEVYRQIVERLKENDNPVLYIYHLKQ